MSLISAYREPWGSNGVQNNLTNLSDYESDELAPGHSLLYGQYEIERHLIDGGFGMTYLARDSLDRQVVIKECFPSTVCRRVNGEVRPRKPAYQDQYQSVIRSFLREALRMAKLDHPNIVKVHQVFQENNTAYIAMDFVDGMDLLTMLDMDPGRLTDTLVETLLRESLNALAYVHELGMLHRDISPDNLLLDAKDKLTLIDFGAAREEAARQSRALSTVMSVKDGYSPHEFYYTDGTQQASSDIYSLGATFYHLITGYAPPDCQKRVADLSSDLPDPFKPLADGNWMFETHILRSIDKALSIPQDERFQSTQEWLFALDNADLTEPDPIPDEPALTETAPEEPAQQEKPKSSSQNLHPVNNGPTPPRPITPHGKTYAKKAVSKPIVRNPAPAQDTPVDAELEPGLVAKISSLVETTNEDVTQGGPGTRNEDEVETQEVDDSPPPLFDIFGQPIDDVEKWLDEQDKQSKRKRNSDKKEKRKKQAKKSRQGDDSSSETTNDDGAGSGLLRVFSKLSNIRNRSVVVVQN